MTRTLTALALALTLGACAEPDTTTPPPDTTASATRADADDRDEPGQVAPPDAVVQAFEAAYPSATEVAWSMEEGGYEASFTDGAVERSVVYAADGTAGAVETEIAVTDLPEAVATTLARDYPGQAVTEAAEIVDGDHTTYEAEVSADGATRDLIFEADGTLVQTETDEPEPGTE